MHYEVHVVTREWKKIKTRINGARRILELTTTYDESTLELQHELSSWLEETKRWHVLNESNLWFFYAKTTKNGTDDTILVVDEHAVCTLQLEFLPSISARSNQTANSELVTFKSTQLLESITIILKISKHRNSFINNFWRQQKGSHHSSKQHE